MTRRAEQLDQPCALAARQVAVDQRGKEHGGHPDDARHAVDGELSEGVARLGGQHQRQVLVAAQFGGGVHDAAHQEVFEVDGAVEVSAQTGEEIFELADSQRLEQDVLATGEHSVERGSRHARLVGDVLDRDLGETPAFAARLGRVEDARLGRVETHP